MDRPFPAYQGDEPYIFVSYSHEDSDVVLPGIQQLRDQGFNIWYDEGISPGASWREELAESILGCDLFIILISPRSADSDNCLKELNYALEHDRPVLAIHQEPTQLSPGLELALNDRQAIFRYDLTEEEYRDKVLSGVKAHIQQGQSIDTESTFSVTRTTSKPILIGAALIATAIVIGSLLLRPSEDVSDSNSEPVIPIVKENIVSTSVPELTQPGIGGIKLKRARYTGKQMSVNYQDEPIQTVLTDISNSADMNLVASSNLDGIRITLALKDVPWDEILDIIAVTKGLEIQVSDRTILIARGVIDGSQ